MFVPDLFFSPVRGLYHQRPGPRPRCGGPHPRAARLQLDPPPVLLAQARKQASTHTHTHPHTNKHTQQAVFFNLQNTHKQTDTTGVFAIYETHTNKLTDHRRVLFILSAHTTGLCSCDSAQNTHTPQGSFILQPTPPHPQRTRGSTAESWLVRHVFPFLAVLQLRLTSLRWSGGSRGRWQ